MASTKLFNISGAEVGSVDLIDAIFDAPLNTKLIHQVVVGYQSSRREGNAETKTRKEVRGGGRKPFRQKGTGHARQGSSREPQMRGGGTVFGPHKRSYRHKTPVRFKRTALCCALSDRVRHEALAVIEGLSFEKPRTKDLMELLEKVAPDAKRTLVVTAEPDQNVIKSATNLPKVAVQTAQDLNAMDVLGAQRVLCSKEAIEALESRLS